MTRVTAALLQRIEGLYTGLSQEYERVVADERLSQQRTSELAQVCHACNSRACQTCRCWLLSLHAVATLRRACQAQKLKEATAENAKLQSALVTANTRSEQQLLEVRAGVALDDAYRRRLQRRAAGPRAGAANTHESGCTTLAQSQSRFSTGRMVVQMEQLQASKRWLDKVVESKDVEIQAVHARVKESLVRAPP